MKITSTTAKKLGFKKHKFGAIRTQCLHGHSHASRKEAMECVKLHQLQEEGKIFQLTLEPVFELMVNGTVVCKHKPDFFYHLEVVDRKEKIFKHAVVEVKGVKTPVWKLKHKMFLAQYPDVAYIVV